MKTTTTFAFLAVVLCCASTAYAETFGSGANTFDIEFVTIGNPGNVADTTGAPNPAGSVAQLYRIGKFEISRDMIIKANAEGGLGITMGDMSPFGGNGADKPATGVSWFESLLFVNWLNTSTGSTPAYKFDGGGNFQLWLPFIDAGYDPNNRYRNSLATYFLPSVDEWYKAAYYNSVTDSYGNYPTANGLEPTQVSSGTAANTAVYGYGQSPSTGPADITLAGGLSPYGTMGQGGNVWEWGETSFDLLNIGFSDPGLRGGSWLYNNSDFLSASERIFADPMFDDDQDPDVGLRVASVAGIPEPSSLLLGVLGAMGLLLWRKALR